MKCDDARRKQDKIINKQNCIVLGPKTPIKFMKNDRYNRRDGYSVCVIQESKENNESNPMMYG